MKPRGDAAGGHRLTAVDNAGTRKVNKIMKAATSGGDSISDLPMDEASRMARARQMGFITDMPLYHGSDDTFSAFDSSQAGRMTGAAPEREATAWVSLGPEIATTSLIWREKAVQIHLHGFIHFIIEHLVLRL